MGDAKGRLRWGVNPGRKAALNSQGRGRERCAAANSPGGWHLPGVHPLQAHSNLR